MIRNLTVGPGLTINGSYNNMPFMSPGAQHAGQMHINTNTGDLEVFDGTCWRTCTISPTVALEPKVQKILEWAENKMLEDQRLKDLMSRHPGLRDTYEKFEIMKALCSKEEDNVSG